MTEFDELIRNKVEQADYPYKPSAWKRFAKHSGIRLGNNPLKIAAISVMAAAAVGGTTWGILTHQSSSRTADPVTESIVAADTMPVTNTEIATMDSMTSIASPQSATAAHTTPNEQSCMPEPIAPEPNQPIAQPAEKPIYKTNRPLGRPVLINVDTITDFEPTEEQLRNGHSRIFD